MPPKTGAEVTLGGETRTLRYTMPALQKVRRARGDESLMQTVANVGQVDVDAICVMVWGGLLHEEPDLERDEAAGLIEPPLRDHVEAIMEALEPWIEIQEEGAKPKGKTGKKKGASD